MSSTGQHSIIAPTRPRGGGLSAQQLNELGLILIILALYAVFWSTARGFITVGNQLNILRDAASIGIAAWGATFIIIAGEIDVSVGPMVALLSVIMSFFLQWHLSLALGMIAALAGGAAFGALAGTLRAYFNVPSFVATLGLWSALRGTALFVTNALPITFKDNDFLDMIGDEVFGLPVSAVVMLVLFAVFAFASRNTAFGRSVFAIGGNASAARLAGIKVKRVRVLLFTIAGLLAGVTGILLTARLGSGNAGAASGLEFDVIAAVVVGGTSLSGGRGSMLGTLFGVIVITLIGNGLVLLGINPFFQQVVRGVIIVVAVLANIMATEQGSRRLARGANG
jgi:ribose/xylose/arabinose/galactoside ABC-type transport system permease subunit